MEDWVSHARECAKDAGQDTDSSLPLWQTMFLIGVLQDIRDLLVYLTQTQTSVMVEDDGGNNGRQG